MSALETGDLSRQGLRQYKNLLRQRVEYDWQTAEFCLAIAKNPNMRDFCLFMLEQTGRLTSEDRHFEAFCAGVFSGVLSQSTALSPLALYHAIPRNWTAPGPHSWRRTAALPRRSGWRGAPLPVRLPPVAAHCAIQWRMPTGVWK